MELFGKPTINPLMFYSGKISGYITWGVLAYSLIIEDLGRGSNYFYNGIIAYFLIAIGFMFTIVSLLHLGKSTRLGLPSESTVLKTNGIYKLSRNPMYVGFGLFTIASMIYTLNLWIIILGIYSIVIYHLIIIGEEFFLEKRFGVSFIDFKRNTRRYL